MFTPRTLLGSGLAIVLAGAYFACAEGTTVEDISTSSGVGGAGGASGLGGSGSGGDDDDGSSAKSSGSGRPSTSAQASSTGASSGDGGGGGGEGGGDGGAGSTGSTGSTSVTSSASTGTQCNFTSPNQCANAESLGSIAGDEAGAPLTLSGSTSKWYKVRIEERSSGISDDDLSWRVNLLSPAGMNYDVIVHEGPQDGDVDCNGSIYNGAADASGETASHAYDDDQGVGGEDDSLWLAIEVRYVSGEACGLSDVWSLTISGNTG